MYQARWAVRNAIRRRQLVRPDSCSQCRTSCKPQAHHFDYKRELDVIWLCKKCHTAVHYPDRPFKPESRIAYYRKYHAKHREKRRQEHRAYKAAHPDICAAASKNWRSRNTKKVKSYWKAWSKAHTSERAKYLREYAKKHRSEINAKRRERRRKKS